MSVVLNSVPHPSSRKKHIDISSTLEQPTGSGDFSTPATLNMDLSEHCDRARNEWPDWCSLYHPKVSDRMPAASFCTLAALAFSKAKETLRQLHFNQTLAGLWPTHHEPFTGSRRHPDSQINEVMTLVSWAEEGSCRNTTPFKSRTHYSDLSQSSSNLQDSFGICSLSQILYVNRYPKIQRLV